MQGGSRVDFAAMAVRRGNSRKMSKGREFKWDEKCQDSFYQLKKRLMSPPVLVMPDLQKGFDIYCDACG
jgi:hypothetical protein